MNPNEIAKIAQIASALEVSGYPKPGNVHRTRDYDDMVFEDFVISGINLGFNTGLAAYYSGTVAGAREGDMVTLIGSDGGCEITLEDMGNLSGRFNYELVCDISKRIPRRFWKDGQIIATQDYFSNNGIEQK